MFPSPSRSSCCQRVGVVLTAMAALSVAAKRSALRRCSAPVTHPSPPGSTWPYPYPYPFPCPILVRIRARQRLNQLTARFEIRMPPTAATAASFFPPNTLIHLCLIAGFDLRGSFSVLWLFINCWLARGAVAEGRHSQRGGASKFNSNSHRKQ